VNKNKMNLWPNQWFEELNMENIEKQFHASSFSDMYLQKPEEELQPVKCLHCGKDILNWFYKETKSRFRYLRSFVIIDISLLEKDNEIRCNEKNKDLKIKFFFFSSNFPLFYVVHYY
jgi:hypothetical protein